MKNLIILLSLMLFVSCTKTTIIPPNNPDIMDICGGQVFPNDLSVLMYTNASNNNDEVPVIARTMQESLPCYISHAEIIFDNPLQIDSITTTTMYPVSNGYWITFRTDVALNNATAPVGDTLTFTFNFYDTNGGFVQGITKHHIVD